jgi:hypothetical protein
VARAGTRRAGADRKACGETDSFDAHIRAALAFASSDVPLAAWRVHEFAMANSSNREHKEKVRTSFPPCAIRLMLLTNYGTADSFGEF